MKLAAVLVPVSMLSLVAVLLSAQDEGGMPPIPHLARPTSCSSARSARGTAP